MGLHRNPVRLLTTMPSFVLVRDVFTVAECFKIIEDVETLIPKENGLTSGNKENKQLRDCSVAWIAPSQKFNWIFEKIDHVMTYTNNEYFNFDLIGYGGIQFTEYKATTKEFYTWHTDMAYLNQSVVADVAETTRKLSISICLNQQESDFEGGNLELNSYINPETAILDCGDAVIFPSFVQHQVTPVTSGTRCS